MSESLDVFAENEKTLDIVPLDIIPQTLFPPLKADEVNADY